MITIACWLVPPEAEATVNVILSLAFKPPPLLDTIADVKVAILVPLFTHVTAPLAFHGVAMVCVSVIVVGATVAVFFGVHVNTIDSGFGFAIVNCVEVIASAPWCAVDVSYPAPNATFCTSVELTAVNIVFSFSVAEFTMRSPVHWNTRVTPAAMASAAASVITIDVGVVTLVSAVPMLIEDILVISEPVQVVVGVVVQTSLSAVNVTVPPARIAVVVVAFSVIVEGC